MTKRDLQEIEAAISRLSAREKRYLLSRIRDDLGKHPLELEWNTDAETIVRAIARSNDFTRRGIRGVLAEDALASNVIEQLTRWEYGTPSGNHPYDFAIEDGSGTVTIQVKNQRGKAGKPLLGGRKYGDVFNGRCRLGPAARLSPRKATKRSHHAVRRCRATRRSNS